MQTFRDKVAVITGGASGIGRAVADRALEEGMRLVVADVEQSALDTTERELKQAGADVLAVRTDVSSAEQVEALAQRTLERFGAVHLLFNNAGVAVGGPIWEHTLRDWQWILGVNLWGVIHGVRTFVPLMLAQGGQAHIVNTASMAGLLSTPGLGAYNVTKHGVVTLSETLALDLAAQGANIKVSVLCPGWVKTRISDSARNRPPALQNTAAVQPDDRDDSVARDLVAQGIAPEQVADLVFEAVHSEKFYILTHPTWKPLIQKRVENIVNERGPASGFGRQETI
jgi:NAD(P)-dependent dehydrogenase (short-subunit alcohol dehydrogenase family)